MASACVQQLQLRRMGSHGILQVTGANESGGNIMETRSFEHLGIKTSLLGFGCMRFPTLPDGRINEVEAERMLDLAISAGVTYFDTAYPYHGGHSEPFLGKVLKKYPRDSFYLASKLPVWDVHKPEDAERIFQEQLERLQTDYIDFYLLHALDKGRWEQMKALGVIEFCEKLQKLGKIRYFGFSFHDSYKVFEEILLYRVWDFCQIQYNYLDRNEQAGDEGYALAERLGVPLIIMEPIKGGNLAGFSNDINQRFQQMSPYASVASFALRWVGSHPNVKVILSGMSDMQQVEDNLRTFGSFTPFTPAEYEQLDDIVSQLRSRVRNGCTGCRYCMPCPAGVNIPQNFKIWNNYHMYRTYGHIQRAWENELKQEEKAANCVQCGKCETLCPQKISIRQDLKQVQCDLDSKIFQ